MEAIDSNLSCSICSDLFINTYTLNCSHSFCMYCIKKWFRNNETCPMCRGVIREMVPSMVIDNLINERIQKGGDEMKTNRKQALAARQDLQSSDPELRETRRQNEEYSDTESEISFPADVAYAQPNNNGTFDYDSPIFYVAGTENEEQYDVYETPERVYDETPNYYSDDSISFGYHPQSSPSDHYTDDEEIPLPPRSEAGDLEVEFFNENDQDMGDNFSFSDAEVEFDRQSPASLPDIASPPISNPSTPYHSNESSYYSDVVEIDEGENYQHDISEAQYEPERDYEDADDCESEKSEDRHSNGWEDYADVEDSVDFCYDDY